ncbi:hypothetical protein PG984_006490 [Apiospora sp. TS-2023a]
MAPIIQSHILIDKISTLDVLKGLSIAEKLTQYVKDPLVKIHEFSEASGEDNIDKVIDLLANQNISQSEVSPLGVIWITDGKLQVAATEKLKQIIFEAMIRIVKGHIPTGPTKKPDEKSYRPYGISFVRIGGYEEADISFKHLDDNLRVEFESYLEDTVNTEVRDHYLLEDNKETYYAQYLDIVDYVELKSDEDVEVQAEKILFGAIDPDLDQKK